MSTVAERETRKFWAVMDGAVREVLGYSCAPMNPTTWWVPSEGYSMTEGHSLFPTEGEAASKARADLLKARLDIDLKLERLRDV